MRFNLFFLIYVLFIYGVSVKANHETCSKVFFQNKILDSQEKLKALARMQIDIQDNPNSYRVLLSQFKVEYQKLSNTIDHFKELYLKRYLEELDRRRTILAGISQETEVINSEMHNYKLNEFYPTHLATYKDFGARIFHRTDLKYLLNNNLLIFPNTRGFILQKIDGEDFEFSFSYENLFKIFYSDDHIYALTDAGNLKVLSENDYSHSSETSIIDGVFHLSEFDPQTKTVITITNPPGMRKDIKVQLYDLMTEHTTVIKVKEIKQLDNLQLQGAIPNLINDTLFLFYTNVFAQGKSTVVNLNLKTKVMKKVLSHDLMSNVHISSNTEHIYYSTSDSNGQSNEFAEDKASYNLYRFDLKTNKKTLFESGNLKYFYNNRNELLVLNKNKFTLYNMNTGKVAIKHKIKNTIVDAFDIDSTHRFLAYLESDLNYSEHTLKIFDLENKNELTLDNFDSVDFNNYLEFTPDGRKLVLIKFHDTFVYDMFSLSKKGDK